MTAGHVVAVTTRDDVRSAGVRPLPERHFWSCSCGRRDHRSTGAQTLEEAAQFAARHLSEIDTPVGAR